MDAHTTLPTPVAPSPRYPWLFVSMPDQGPTFDQIVDSARSHYGEHSARVPLVFPGWLTNWLIEDTFEVELSADAYGFSSGADYSSGFMTVDVHFRDYVRRYGSGGIRYSFRDRVFERTLEFASRGPRAVI